MPWIRFFLTGVAEQAIDSDNRTRRLLDLRERYRERVKALSRSPFDPRMIDALFESPATTVPGAAKRLQVSAPTARAGINRLVEAGILREATARRRNRLYFAPDIIELVQTPVLPESN